MGEFMKQYHYNPHVLYDCVHSVVVYKVSRNLGCFVLCLRGNQSELKKSIDYCLAFDETRPLYASHLMNSLIKWHENELKLWFITKFPQFQYQFTALAQT